MVDGEWDVGRNQQQLAAPAEALFSIDIRKHLPFHEEQKSETRQGSPWDFRRFYGKLGFHTLDEESVLRPISPSFPIRNDSFHSNLQLVDANIVKSSKKQKMFH